MNNNSLKVLIISSCKLSIGPAVIAKQYYDAFLQQGYETDLLLKYPEKEHPEYLYVVDDNYGKSLLTRIRNKIIKLINRKWRIADNSYHFFYTKEKYPPVPAKLVVNKIKKKYDLVLIVFWQELLSFKTIQKIYNKSHCQIHFIGVDYSQMSGGCHFTLSCDHYKTGCGECPALKKTIKNDFTLWNVKYRERVYNRVKPIVYGNKYMQKYYSSSYLLKNANCELLTSMIIDTDVFKPLDQKELRTKYKIPAKKKYVLLFGSQDLDNPKKGVIFLLESLSFLSKTIIVENEEIMVVMVGRGFDRIKDRIPFDSIGIDYVPLEKLPEIYSMSTCFICPSIDDAGPMMVNQSLCCGTPVVGFEIGSVMQVVKNKGTGISVPVKNTQKLAEGIQCILKMQQEEYDGMRRRCRNVALQTSSYKAQIDLIISAYEKYKGRL